MFEDNYSDEVTGPTLRIDIPSLSTQKARSITSEKVFGDLGWKNLLLVQFQRPFTFAIYVGIIASYCIIVFEAGLSFSILQNETPLEVYITKTKGVIYAFDAFFFMDVMFMIIFKNTEWPEYSHRFKARNAGILIMEMCSLIPIDGIYYAIAVKKKPSSVNFLRLRYVFRIIRIFYDQRIPSAMTKEQSLIINTEKLLITVGVMCCTLAALVLPYICELKCFPEELDNVMYYYLYVASEKITGKGFGKVYFHANLNKGFAIQVFNYIGFMAYLVMGYIVSKAICMYISNDNHVYSYLTKYKTIKDELNNWRKRNLAMWRMHDECLVRTIEAYYRLIWTKKRWCVTMAFTQEVLPKVMFKDVYLDMSWNGFKHSHLFKNQEVHFLREVATYMNHLVCAPGELLYGRDREKQGMFYIKTGIVQVLSEENGETPIISFSGGTCLGESTLIIGYDSNWSVMCKTYCEISFLKRSDFIKVSLIYPREYHRLITTISRRYLKARRYRELSEYQWEKLLITNPDTVIMIWLKKTLHQLVENETIYKQDDSFREEELVFCPDYLNLLVITEDIELVIDMIFLKTTFPAIFQPESVVLDGWNIFISIIALIIFLFYPCYALYCGTITHATHVLILSIITFICLTDLYIQSSTAVRTKDTLLTTIPSIIYNRLTNTGFLVDLFSSIPISIFFILMNNQVSYETLVLTEIHKLLKIYRLNFTFSKLEMLRITNKMVLKYFKVFLVDFFLFYYTALVLYYVICNSTSRGCPKEYLNLIVEYFDDSQFNVLLHLFTVASTFLGNMTFTDLLKFIKYDQVGIVIAVQFLYAFCSVFVLAYICIMETLREKEVHQYKEFVATVDVVLKDLNVSSGLQRRISLYLTDQFWDNKGLHLLNPMLFKNNMSNNLYSLMNQIRYEKLLHDLPLLADLEETIIIDFSRKLKVTHYPPGEVITYAGEVCKEMHVIEVGFCQVLGSQNKILHPSESFCVIETCMRIPTFYTVVTLTDCNVLSLSQMEYARLATKYPDFGASISEALEYTISGEKINQIQSTNREVDMLKVDVKDQLCRKFNVKTTLEKMRYSSEFGTLMFFMKFIIMRRTFPTNGKFIFYWEWSRLIFAFATNIFTRYAYTADTSFPYYFCLCMDMTAWVDIYVRHHVCYYNDKGTEVSHPAKTYIHYWTNGLLIDMLSCAPIDYLFGQPSTKPYLKLNRFLQLYRPLRLMKYINDNNISRSKLYDLFKYIPFVFVTIDFMSTIATYLTCASPININLENVSCTAEHWAKLHLNNTNLSPQLKLHTASLIVTATSLTVVSFHRVYLSSKQELLNAGFFIIFGHIFFVWMAARLVSNSFYNETDLIAYQEAMRHLLTFVAARKIDKNIKNEIIAYYEFMWKKTKGKDLMVLLNAFSTAIKEDILYDMFGKALNTSSTFLTAPKSFFKSLLLESTYEVYVHKGIIYRVNDVHGYIYILLKGTIDVLGADYNKLLILSPGSIFGNLDNVLRSRQTLTMIAKGHVEVLKIASLQYHVVISKYPQIMRFYTKLTRFNVDYIENHDEDLMHKYSTMTMQSIASLTPSGGKWRRSSKSSRMSDKVDILSLSKMSATQNYSKVFRVIKNNGWIKFIRLSIICISCFFGFHLEIYQLGNYDDNVIVICLLYFCDLLYLGKMYLDFFTSYVDDTGLIVTDLFLIKKRYMSQPFGFYFDLVALIPAELFSLGFITQSYFWIIWTWFRKNRLIKVIYYFYLLKVSKAKLHVNVKIVSIIHIISWLTILLQTMSILLLMSHIIENTNHEDKLSLLINSFEMITYAASGTALTEAPFTFTIYSIISVLITMLVCKFFITLFIAELCSLIENVYQNKSKYRIYALYLKYQLREEDVSVPLRKRVGEYLNLLWIHHRGFQYPSLLNQAPYYLKEAILNAMYGFHLRRHPLIKHCHTDLIRQMSATFDVLIFFPGNFVAYIGDIDGCMYFIHKGEIQVLIEDSLQHENAVDVLRTGDCFGLDQGLYKNCGHDYSYKVTKKSIVIALNKDKWFHLLKFFPASKTVLFDLRNAYMDNY
nr:uncharacterized protein LOC111425116 [Onthophagus taurus]